MAHRARDAEAMVRTLATELAGAQQRLREAEEQQERLAGQVAEREREVRRVAQREYAEQQLRVEAEEERERLQRERRVEAERQQRRLAAGERHARDLATELEGVRRELSEAEQAVAAERAAVRRTERKLADHERELTARKGEIARRESDLARRELDLERARAESEKRLQDARAGERAGALRRAHVEQERVEMMERLGALEGRIDRSRLELEQERAGRVQAEQALAALEQEHARLAAVSGAVTRTATALVAALRAEREETHRELQSLREELREHARAPARPATPERSAIPVAPGSPIASVRPVALAEPPTPPVPTPPAAPPEGSAQEGADMARALTAAVERLRARAAAAAAEMTPAEEEPESAVSAPVEPPAPERVDFSPRMLVGTPPREPWLARAIRRIAESGEARLAGELICELLPAQGLVLERPLSYRARIIGVGTVEVRVEGGRASVKPSAGERVARGRGGERVDFTLEGSAAALAELAAGGYGRRLAGVRLRGRRRRARRLMAACREPLTLPDLAQAGIAVWPGLLLRALAEAIDPAWTEGQSFTLAFEIEDAPGWTACVRVRGGEPIRVERLGEERPDTRVRVSERALLHMLAGVPLPSGERVLVEGSERPLQTLLYWADRAQGSAA
ncbi:MAG TPA: hypothetical protein VGX16_05160 [Solirubrobacteraceae bacterium]|nr:hypothetical protein [Solirubrobacteraceae bacterium]